MTQKEIITGRLANARGWLNSVLPRLTQEMILWAPAEGMRTISGQLVEVIAIEAELVPTLRDGKGLTEEEVAAIVKDPNDLETLLNVLTEVRGQTLAYLDSLSEADLAEEVSVPQWYGAYWPKLGPRGEHFRNVAEHEFYHVGQLISYLWARGDDPFEW